MAFWHRLKKKVLKRYVLHAFFPATRPAALRWCGWEVGDEVYIADGLIIVEELAERDNLRIGHRVSIAPRVTLVTSSHPNSSRIRGVAPVARGPIVATGPITITGSVRSFSEQSIGKLAIKFSGASIRYSRCAVERALRLALDARPGSQRSWAEIF